MSVGGPSSPIGPAEDRLLGRVLSQRYRILKKLGEGGMGAVYMAEHVVIEKRIALKVLFPDLARRPDLVQRFLQEAKSASRIGHENVIDINDFGQSEEGEVFIAMELLTGTELGQVLRQSGSLSWERAQPIFLQIAKALRAAHEKGIVHRDMKPENVFIVSREGRDDFVKVLDFGIAKIVGMDEEGPRLTRTGMIFGTPEYMAPEQAQGAKIDRRVDVYAVGCIMYHVLTGTVPFRAESFMAVLSKHMLEEPVRPSAHDASIPAPVEAIVLKAMAKDPGARYQSMGELCEMLGSLGPLQDFSGRVELGSGRGKVALPSGPGRGAVSTSRPTDARGGDMPLAPPNPELRRSETEMVSRHSGEKGGAPDRAPAASRRWIWPLVAALVLAGAGLAVGLNRRASPDAETRPAVPPERAAAVLPGVPPVAPPASSPAAAPVVAVPDPVAPLAVTAPAKEGRRRDDQIPSKKRRSSREVIEALQASGTIGGDAPAPRAMPEPTPEPTVKAAVPVSSPEIKNPFAPGP